MQRTERSFIKNAKDRKEQNVLLKRTDAQPCYVHPSPLAPAAGTPPTTAPRTFPQYIHSTLEHSAPRWLSNRTESLRSNIYLYSHASHYIQQWL